MTPPHSRDARRLRGDRILERLLSASSQLAGVCVALMSAVSVIARSHQADTLADDGLAVTSLLFLLCCALSMWGLRTADPVVAGRVSTFAEALFLVALSAMVGIGFVVVYSVF